MREYLDLLQDILDNGEERVDRTGVGTIAVFGRQVRYDLRKGFPAVTTKKLAWKAVVSELLWFLEGSRDERRLCEILHGTRDDEKRTIWTDNATASYWKDKAEFPGDCGRGVYGQAWRHWGPGDIDQIANLVASLKKDPTGRRHLVIGYNPSEVGNVCLPPCHAMFQFYVSNKKELSCQMYQRSADSLLGIPFNIASYALLTHMIAQVCDLKVGEFIHALGDTHIYLNHVPAVHEQLDRAPFKAPQLFLNADVRDIFSFKMGDVILDGYQSHMPLLNDTSMAV